MTLHIEVNAHWRTDIDALGLASENRPHKMAAGLPVASSRRTVAMLRMSRQFDKERFCSQKH
jgi:hypothetical protein